MSGTPRADILSPMASTDLPAWCPPPLASACASRAKAPLASYPETAAQIAAASGRLRAEQAASGAAALLMVHKLAIQ